MSEIDTKNVYSQLGLTHRETTDEQARDELGQAQFLELMTAQLRFQDPLKPMENGDFLGQMAQFGTVSGINELNSSMAGLSTSFQSNQALQASTLVGRRVLVPSGSGFLGEQGPMQASVELDQPASQVVISVTDGAGQLVHREQFGVQQAGMLDYQWNGENADGNRMPAGEYRIAAEIHRGDEITSGAMFTLVDVESVAVGAGGADLTLSVSGLGDIGMSQVRKIL